MSDTSLFISVGKQQLHYRQWGSGKRLLLAFHGYGNDALIFAPFKEYLAAEYTILSFDLPHHGDSKWPDNTLLTQSDLISLVEAIKEKHKATKLSLVGYSMGGRICMAIAQHMPQYMDKVVLIAADGLTTNSVYYFCTRTWIGKKIFMNMLRKPARYLGLIDLLKRIKILDPTRYRFVTHHLKSAENRNFLLQVWSCTSDLVPEPRRLREVIRQYRIQVFIFMGAHDRIMPVSLAKRFGKGLDTVQVFILDKGHRVFDDENARRIAESLL